MTILRAEMTRRVTINILWVDISSILNQSLYNTEIASQTCNVQRSPEIVGSCINLSTEFDQYLNEWRMSFRRGQMQRSKTIWIGAIDNFHQLILLVEVLLGESEDLDYFVPIAHVYFSPVVHLDFFHVLIPLPFFGTLLTHFARACLDTGGAGIDHLLARVISEFISLFIIIVGTRHLICLVSLLRRLCGFRRLLLAPLTIFSVIWSVETRNTSTKACRCFLSSCRRSQFRCYLGSLVVNEIFGRLLTLRRLQVMLET